MDVEAFCLLKDCSSHEFAHTRGFKLCYLETNCINYAIYPTHFRKWADMLNVTDNGRRLFKGTGGQHVLHTAPCLCPQRNTVSHLMPVMEHFSSRGHVV